MSINKPVVICACFAASTFAASPLTNFSRPLSFEPNRGQTDLQVEFLAHGLNYNVFFSNGNAVMVAGHDVVRMTPVGANRAARGEPVDPLPGISNYFIGNDPAKWRTNVPTYAKVRYSGVYPGVDLIYYGNQRQLEYDFILQPGADPRAVVLNFESKTPPKLNSDGELVLHTSSGNLTLHKPIAYQEIGGKRQSVECAYVQTRGRLRFSVGAYDATKTLVIDPVIVYSTYLGGSGTRGAGGDTGNGIAVDGSGNAYVAGSTMSDDFPTKDPLQARNANQSSAFVTKFDAAGTGLVYSTYLGSPSGSGATGIAVDKDGEAYVTGGVFGSDFPTNNAFQSKNNCSGDCENAFVTKLAASGAALVFSTYLGGSGPSSAAGIAVGPAGGAYVTGSTQSTDFPTKNAFQSKNNASYGTAFVTKFSPAGDALIYSTYLGGSGSDAGTAIAVEGESAYVTGLTYSTDFPLEHPFQDTNKAYGIGSTAFITKLAVDGSSLVYSTYLGGSGCANSNDEEAFGDEGYGIAVDGKGEAYVVGSTGSPDFPIKNALLNTLPACGPSGFVTKLDAAGTSLVYSTFLGGSGVSYGCDEFLCTVGDWATAVAVDIDGNAYITGQTISTDFPIKDAFDRKVDRGQPNGAYNAFITKFCPIGSLLYSSYLGGSGGGGSNGTPALVGDGGRGVAVDSSGSAYVTGFASSTDFPTKNAFQSTNKAAEINSQNAFVTKVTPR